MALDFLRRKLADKPLKAVKVDHPEKILHLGVFPIKV
jgi:hypothetical protein